MAVVFIASSDGHRSETKGLCLKCASDVGMKPVTELMNHLGLSPEDTEAMSDEMTSLMENSDFSIEDLTVSREDLINIFNAIGEGEQDTGTEAVKALPGQTPATPVSSGEIEPVKNAFNNSVFRDSADSGGGYSSKRVREKREKRKFLDNYCNDLTSRAKEGKLDRIIGRDKEIYRAMQILNRRTKNNPCLIGEPGVGKTAIAEGIALRIAAGNVPEKLRGRELFQLDMTAIVAGTQFRGQFESRVRGLIEEVKKAGNIILFIDEVHSLVGAGESEGAMNAANIFKPALSRGEIQVIGATTFNEYRKYIERDAALERRFQPITVEEPSVADSVEIIAGVKDYYEKYHHVAVSDAIIRDIVILSERYITDRYLPDKAIDLLDEACSRRSLESPDLAEYERARSRRDKLIRIQENIVNQPEIDYERLANVRSEISKLSENISLLEAKVSRIQVTEEDLARVIELWTGISSAKVKQSELERVAGLEERLKRRIIGQDSACGLVAAAIRRSKVQVSSRRRPASFIFVGPTAVGKTELVKVLADELFDSPDPLIRLDMSEYMEQHSVSKIIGAPPGYVGYDEAGQLTEKIRRRPYSVILLDEIEKAHPNVMNILLQILDEGRITDSHGRKVNFENTVIVMTSNAGSQFAENAMGFNKTKEDMSREKVLKALGEFLRPEFLSRVDEVVVFSPLTKEDYAGIAALLLDELKAPLKEKDINFGYDRAACELIAEMSFGKKTGAREIRRLIRREVEDQVVNFIVDNPSNYWKLIKFTAEEGKFELIGI
jgi:ATP-dependent Clp protease ATP-binding subunit ClpA